ncbi:Gfo/Idh/MocA family protein [Kineococcus rubinsiae]|uniref:Gfo/Idh/MocA family protein n=1 Tax=Kineococcus rubinsiae TaxID=2609562 RepID=UPI0027E55EC1|nr:Gfo/Idh/MocA family oxidoreductase [Kineococcus rubinsiae]
MTPSPVPPPPVPPEPGATTGWVIAGAGWVARDHMAPALAASPTSRVVAVVDRDPAAARELAARFEGARAATDLGEAFATPGAQVAYVATPNHAHREVVAAAAAAGLAVLCEKPLAATLADAADLVAACEAAGVLAATAFDQRWHPAHRAAAELIAGGRLGTVTSVRIIYGCWLPPDWAPPGSTTGDNWRVDPARAGGGAYVDLAPHGLDLVGALLGEDVERATTHLQHRVHDYAVDDGSVLVGSTASGVLVSIANSFNTVETLPRRRLEVVGTAGQLVATDTMGQTAGGRLELLDAATGAASDVPFDGVTTPFAAQVRAVERALSGETPWPFPLARDLRLLQLLTDALPPVPTPSHSALEVSP